MSQLPAHQERVVTEKDELDVKLTKLKTFFETEIYDNLDPAEHDRLAKQADIMEDYSDILGERIAAFSSEVADA